MKQVRSKIDTEFAMGLKCRSFFTTDREGIHFWAPYMSEISTLFCIHLKTGHGAVDPGGIGPASGNRRLPSEARPIPIFFV